MDKIIITNATAMLAKYGQEGYAAIRAAVDRIVAADAGRGLRTAVYEIDQAAQMATIGAQPVDNPESARQNKMAVDALDEALAPDYVMILGSTDVIPHQALNNPLYDGAHDPDRSVPSDLRYACDAPFGNDVAKYTGPTRVVGRVPDLTGHGDPAYLLGVLDTVVGWRSRPRSEYARYFGISAQVWEDSSALSLLNVFGSSDEMQIIPPRSHEWSVELLARPAHFINCHGAIANPRYYGQQGGRYPVAHDAQYLSAQQLTEGTIVAAECCYGAELYNPAMAGDVMGLCNTYMAKRAYAFFGSSTIAYGPATGNGSADYICQFFLNGVLGGASAGRAALTARQEFVRRSGLMDPVDLKTLAQFNLMGDPSVQPVEAPVSHALSEEGGNPMRSLRRHQLRSEGKQLARTIPVAKRVKATASAAKIGDAVQALIRSSALGQTNILSYNIRGGGFSGSGAKGFAHAGIGAKAGAGGDGAAIHVVLGSREPARDGGVGRGVALVVWEENGAVVAYRELHQR